MFNKQARLWEELLDGEQMDYFGHWHPRWLAQASDFGQGTFHRRFEFLGDIPHLARSYSEPDVNTGHPLPRESFIRIRPSDNLQELRGPGQQWIYPDLRRDTIYYKVAALVQPGALADLKRYGIRGNTNIKRLRFE